MHTLHVWHQGNLRTLTTLDAIETYLHEPDLTLWLDLEAPDEAEIALLQKKFGFHPLAIEDAVRPHERPKVEAYPGYYLIIFYSALYVGEGPTNQGAPPSATLPDPQIDLRQLAIFAGKNFIVTIHHQPIVQVRATLARWTLVNAHSELSVAALLHALLDAIVDDYFTLMDQIVDWVEELEDTIFSRFREGAIAEIFAIKKDLLLLRRVVTPERDVLNILLRQEVPIFQGGSLVYLQDVYDHLVRVTDTVDTYRDLLSSALDSYLSLQSNQLNQLIKTLTLSSIILMSCSLIAGIYGMNFHYMPELSWPLGYLFALSMMLVVGFGLFMVFRSRRWW